MEFTNIPHLKGAISRVGFGTWAIGGWMWGGTNEQEAIAAIRRGLDLGINLIDTAPVYGFGSSEEIVGKALKEHGKREHIVIATKLGLGWKNEQEVYRDSRRESILKEIDASLRRLQVDYIDLYQVHWPDPLTPFEDTAEAMHQLLKAGKIRSIGVCNFSIEQMEAFQKGGPLHSMQSPFNLFERQIENKELAYGLKNKLATLGYGSICRGLLSGKMGKQPSFKGDDLRKGDPKFQEPRFSQYLKCVERLQDWVQKKYRRPMLALAIRWALDKGISVALWGTRNPGQLSEIETIFGWKLTAQDFQEIDQIVKETVTDPDHSQSDGPPNRK